MDGDARGAAGTMAEGEYSQVVFCDGVWWHWRRPTPTFPAWVPVTGHDPQPTRRVMDVAGTRARIERTVRQ